MCGLLAFLLAWRISLEGKIVLNLSVFPIEFVSVDLSFHHRCRGPIMIAYFGPAFMIGHFRISFS